MEEREDERPLSDPPPEPLPHLAAVIIGAGEFPHYPQFARQTEKNEAFRRSLQALRVYLHSCGVPADQIFDVFDSDASPKDMLEEIASFLARVCCEKADPITDVLIAFVGHGAGTREEYAVLIRNADPAFLPETTLRVSRLVARVKLACDTVHRRRGYGVRQYYILDACYAGRAKYAASERVISGAKGTQSSHGLPDTGISVLCSCNEHEESVARSGEPYTLFTTALLAVLSADATACPELEAWYPATPLALAHIRELVHRWQSRTTRAGERVPPTVGIVSLDTFGGDCQDVPLLPNPRHRRSWMELRELRARHLEDLAAAETSRRQMEAQQREAQRRDQRRQRRRRWLAAAFAACMAISLCGVAYWGTRPTAFVEIAGPSEDPFEFFPTSEEIANTKPLSSDQVSFAIVNASSDTIEVWRYSCATHRRLVTGDGNVTPTRAVQPSATKPESLGPVFKRHKQRIEPGKAWIAPMFSESQGWYIFYCRSKYGPLRPYSVNGVAVGRLNIFCDPFSVLVIRPLKGSEDDFLWHFRGQATPFGDLEELAATRRL